MPIMFLYFWALASPRLVEFPNINPWIFIKASQGQCLLQVMKNPISFGFDPFEVLLAPTGSLMEPLLISLITQTYLSQSKPSQF